MKLVLLSVLVAFSFGQLDLAWSHTRLKSPIPRSNRDNHKTGPCGSDVKATPTLTVEAGSQVKVDWEETIQHPGWYELNWSKDNDATFAPLPGAAKIIDTQDGGGLPHQYTFTVTVPNEACDNCTLQLVQMMTENPANPRPYFSCTDIKVTAAVIPPDPGPDPDPDPAPDPDPVPGDDSDVGKQGVGKQNGEDLPSFGGCGLVAGSGPGGPGPWGALLVLLPLLVLLRLYRPFGRRALGRG